MTTNSKNLSQNFLALTFFLAIFVPLSLSAQTVQENSSEGSNSEVSTSTPSDSTAINAPWFRLEKLNGDNFNQGDFVVGPGRIEIEGKPGETIVKEISVTNRISDNHTFELTVEDIEGSDDPDTSVVLLGAEKGPYTIKDYVSFPNKTFTLNLGERAWVPVTISIPPNAEPGGFYGSILISTIRESENASNETAKSPVIARVGTLFFLTVPGDIKREGYTKELSLMNKKWWYESGPINLNILYENKGSVHLNPYGEIRIKNTFGEEVGFLEIEPWFALPESLRTREVTWDREMLFGRYVVTAHINRGYDDIIDEVSTSFWVLPWKIVGGTFLVVFIIIFAVRIFFRTFEFKKKA